jgi:mannose-6-phosphate isomerase-like protein (cupin superfamily)
VETVNGCTVIARSEAPEPTTFGPAETNGAYRVLVGMIPANQPAPPFHRHPHTDEAFHIVGGEATFLLDDREVRVGAGGFIFIPRGTPTRPGTLATARCLG